MRNSLDNYTTEIIDPLAHRDECIDLWSQQGRSKAENTMRFDWYYSRPAMSNVIMFALKYADEEGKDKIIGTITISAREWYVDEEVKKLAVLGDFFVDSNHRSLGPAVKLIRDAVAFAKEEFSFIYTFPNRRSEPVAKRVGLKKLGVSPRYSRPFESRSAFQTNKTLKHFAFLSPLVDLALMMNDKLKFHNSSLSGELLSKTDERFDKLWQSVSKKNLCIGERSGAMLQWRLLDKWDSREQIFAVKKKDESELYGYIAFKIDDTNHCLIDDILSRDGVEHIKNLLLYFIQFSRQQQRAGVSMSFWGAPKVVRQLTSLHMHPREGRPIYFAEGNHTESNITSGNCFLTQLDEDQ